MMIPKLEFAYSNFLEAEKKQENQEAYGRAKWELFCSIKLTVDALRYYANGTYDGGDIARAALVREGEHV